MSNRLVRGLMPGGGGTSAYYTTTSINVNPTIGPNELLSNGTFVAWTGDNPDGWTVIGETGAALEVTERAPANGHGDAVGAGGAANFYHESAVNSPVLIQTILTVGSFYRVLWSLTKRVAGDIRVGDGINGMLQNKTAVADYVYTGRATHANFAITLTNSAATSNVTVDTFSVKILSALEQLLAHTQPYGDFSVTLTIPTALYQGGVTFNYTDANNYSRCYFDRLDGKVYVTKRVSGTPTVVGSWSALYSAGAILTLRRHIDGTMDVIYNSTTLATGLIATGLTGVQAGPFLTDASGVSIGSYTWDARTTT